MSNPEWDDWGQTPSSNNDPYQYIDSTSSINMGQFETVGYDSQQPWAPGPPQTQPYGYPGYPEYIAPNDNAISGDMNTGLAPQSYIDNDGDVDELPLLEELGINFGHIQQKTLSVLHPLRDTDLSIIQDDDLAGPLVFALLFGTTLLLSGKLHFNYIYGIGVIGCIGMYFLLNQMSSNKVTFACVVSILGYCLLPLTILSFISGIFSLVGPMGWTLSLLTISWCSFSASRLFTVGLGMVDQQLLIAYPCALLYGVFALLTIF